MSASVQVGADWGADESLQAAWIVNGSGDTMPLPPSDRAALTGLADRTKKSLGDLTLSWQLFLPGLSTEKLAWFEAWSDGELLECGWDIDRQVDVAVQIPYPDYIRYRSGLIGRFDALPADGILSGDIDELLALSGMLDLTYDLLGGTVIPTEYASIADLCTVTTAILDPTR